MTRKLISLLALLMMAVTGARADVKTIGSGSSTDYHIPSFNYWNYSLTQQIYTPAEIDTRGGTISSIAFKSVQSVSRKLDVYLVQTSETGIGTKKWITPTEDNMVFSGEVNFIADEWTTLPFTKFFEYDGNSNLAVIVDDNSGIWDSDKIYFYVFWTQNQSIVIRSDDTNFKPTNGITLEPHETIYYKNQIQLGIEPYDGRPSSVAVSEITRETAVVTWESEGSLWNLQYKAENAADWTQVAGLTQKSYTLTGLTAGEDYFVQVQIDRGNGELSGWKTVKFTTMAVNPVPANVTVDVVGDYSANATWNGWGESYLLTLDKVSTTQFYNFDNNTLPSVITPGGDYPWILVEHNGGYCLQSGNAGVDGSSSVISATVTYTFDGTIEFDAQCMGDEYNENNIWDECTFIIDDDVMFEKGKNGVQWDHYSYPVKAGTHTFIWKYEKNWSNNPNGDRFAIDNLVMNATEVLQETNFNTQNTEYAFSNLAPNTSYLLKVQSVKGDDTSDYSAPVLFTTLDSNPVPTNVTVDDLDTSSAHATWDGSGTSYTLSLAEVSSISFYGFDDKKLPRFMANGGDYPWMFVAHDGGFCLQSGNAGVNSSSSEISATVTYTVDGMISFDAKCMGETYNGVINDKCTFSIDGQSMFLKGANGEQWVSYSYPVEAGTHTFTWKYEKDWTDHPSGDCFAIDNLSIGDKTEIIQESSFSTNNTEYTFSNLSPNKYYQLKVKSHKDGYDSDYSTPVLFTILQSYPLEIAENTLQKLTEEHAGEAISINLTRTFSSGVTSTICLPFDMTSVTGGKVYRLDDVVWDETENAWVATMNDATPDGNLVTSTTAGMPYLFMPETDGDVSFKGVIAEVPSNPAAFTLINAESNSWVMTGTYSQIVWEDGMDAMFGFAATAVTGTSDIAAVEAGEFVRAGAGAIFPAYRAFLKYEGTNEVLQARDAGSLHAPAATSSEVSNPHRVIVRLIGKSNETTGITTMNAEVTSDKWFTIDGRLVNGQPNQKGIYVKNGKKVVIK